MQAGRSARKQAATQVQTVARASAAVAACEAALADVAGPRTLAARLKQVRLDHYGFIFVRVDVYVHLYEKPSQ